MARVWRVPRIRADQDDVDDVPGDDRPLLGDVAPDDDRHHARDGLRRVRAVAGPRGPGLSAPRRGVAQFEALEAGRRQSAAEVIILPPLGAPPVDGASAYVFGVTDDEG